jgi:membrane-bound lytic murein transglycosylase B
MQELRKNAVIVQKEEDSGDDSDASVETADTELIFVRKSETEKEKENKKQQLEQQAKGIPPKKRNNLVSKEMIEETIHEVKSLKALIESMKAQRHTKPRKKIIEHKHILDNNTLKSLDKDAKQQAIQAMIRGL